MVTNSRRYVSNLNIAGLKDTQRIAQALGAAEMLCQLHLGQLGSQIVGSRISHTAHQEWGGSHAGSMGLEVWGRPSTLYGNRGP